MSGLPPVTWVLGDLSVQDASIVQSLSELLASAGWPSGSTASSDASAPGAVLVWTRSPWASTAQAIESALGRSPVLLLGPSASVELPEVGDASGLLTGSWAAEHPARIRPAGAPSWVSRVCPVDDHLNVVTPVLSIDKYVDDVEVWAATSLGMKQHPVMTWNRQSRVGAMSLVPPERDPASLHQVARLLHLSLRRVVGLDGDAEPEPRTMGLLGYGAIGAEHARAAEALPGLRLSMVCDRDTTRLENALRGRPDVRTTSDAAELLTPDGPDLVVVSTPPDTHAHWAVTALEAGKDVVVEKPFSLTTADADRVVAAARHSHRRVVVYQNRRFDPDYLAVKRAITSGQIGEVFHFETFVGGFDHPCNYWHSDEDVSGGALFDWGSHVLDQVLALHTARIAHVTCVEHKRKWHDVTNADHTTLHIRFVDGAEATFIHSDLAAARKPRWYVLGTEGAITSEWRDLSVVARNEIGTLAEDRLRATDSPPEIRVTDSQGAVTALSLPEPPRFGFHRQLVDDLLFGWPMEVSAIQSRRVVAVMQAARDSARAKGAPVEVDGES